jgi:tetratricopeptide (TPR) repeat protein
MERCVKRGIYPKTNDIFLKGFELFEQNRYDEALRAFEESVKAKPDSPEMRYGLGLMYLFTGNKIAALEEYRILRSLDAGLSKRLIGFISPSNQFTLDV